jgi:carboxylesterase
VQLVLLHDSYHMITIDRERRVVMASAVDFAASVAQAPATGSGERRRDAASRDPAERIAARSLTA